MNKFFLYLTYDIRFLSPEYSAQYQPKNINKQELEKARQWVDKTYNSLSQDEKLGQLFITALYTNKDQNHIILSASWLIKKNWRYYPDAG
jgi:hypothetical protein